MGDKNNLYDFDHEELTGPERSEMAKTMIAYYRWLRDQAAGATEKPNDSASNWYIYMEKSLADSGCVCSRMTIEAAARAAERLLKVELERQIHAGRDYHEELIEENSIPSYAEFDAIGPWMKRIRVRLSKETASVVEYYLPDIAKAALDVHRKIIAETAAAPTAAAEPGPTDAEELLLQVMDELRLAGSRGGHYPTAALMAIEKIAQTLENVLTNRRRRNGN